MVQVEVATAQTHKYKTISEQTALLSLTVALGDMQKLAGPDQRSTARADILTDLSTSEGAPAEDKKYLTGVWSTEPVANGTGDMQFLGWLASGAPDEVPANMSDWHEDVWPGETAVLVGDNSADDDATRGNENPYKIIAQKIELSSEKADVLGHHAYWIGDEGIKAKLNMVESPDELANNPSGAAQFNRLHAIQKVDPLLLEEEAGLDYSQKEVRDRLAIATSRDLFEFVGQIAASNTPSIVRSGFHDYTLLSQGLLTNALQGGLKVDLTRGLDDQPLTGPIYDDTDDDKPAPNWDMLSSYYGLKDEVNDNAIGVREQTDTVQGIYPVLLGDDMAYGLYFKNIPDTTNYQLYAAIWTAVVMHNPYDVALAPTNYIFESSNLPDQSTSPFRFKLLSDGSWNKYDVDPNILAATGEDSRFIRYMTTEPIGFEPGEVKVLSTQAASGFAIDGYYTASSMPDEAKVMAPGYEDSGYYLMIPLTQNTRPGTPYPDGIYSQDDLYNASTGNYSTIEFQGAGTVSLNVYAVGSDNSEKYIGGISHYGAGTAASGAISRATYLDTLIGLRAGGTRTLMPRSAGGYGWRTLADFNYRAIKDPADENIAFTMWAGGGDWASGNSVNTVMGANAIAYNPSDTDAAYAGRSYKDDGLHEVVLFAVPRERIFSVGDLRHANLRNALYLTTTINPQDYTVPSYVIGNSWANPYMSLDEADYTYRVNEAIWDQYFFSSILAGTVDWSSPFANSRIFPAFLDPNDQSEVDAVLRRDEAAEYLAVDGAFNINSTSVAAWRALLGGLSGIIDDPDDFGGKLENVFPRITHWASSDYLSGDIGNNNNISNIPRMWSGFRSLSDAELDALAVEIVEQIKLRGPFPSVARFVNRTLTDRDPEVNADPAPEGNARLRVLVDQHDTRLKGTLQAAIDNVDVDADGLPDINEDLRQTDFQETLGSAVKPPIDSSVGEPIGVRDEDATRSTFGWDGLQPQYPENSYGYLSTDAPGFFSQTDVLSVLAPLMAVRSDTFIIRCYGDAVNPLTEGVERRSWCEAIVQRTPELLDKNDPSAGRLFRLISFRWLKEDDV